MFFLMLLAALGLWIAFLVTLAISSPGRSAGRGAESGPHPIAHGFFSRV